MESNLNMNMQYNLAMFAVAGIMAAVYLFDTMWMKKNRFADRPGGAGTSFLDKPYMTEIVIFAVALLVLFLLNGNRFIVYNNFSYLADALLHGRLDSPDLPAYLESVEFAGHKYMHFAPGTAILCIPFVAVWGVDGFNVGYLCMVLGAADSALFYRLFSHMEIGRTKRDRLWFTAFATFGTVHVFLAAVAHSWFFAHVTTWFYLLLAMCLITDNHTKKQNLSYVLGGIFFGMAVTCRLSNLVGAIFFLGYIWLYKPDKIKGILLFGCGAALPGGLYMLYNVARFGTILDKSYNLTHLKDYFRDRYDEMQTLATKKEQLAYLAAAEKEVGGPLQLQFIKYNMYTTFLMMPRFQAVYPYVVPLVTGVSLTFLSPAVYFCVCADWKKKISWVLAAAALVSALPFFLNYGNGTAQFGVRYAMDFLPYMILLACMGMGNVGRVKALLISYCIFANVWGPLYWRFFYS